MGNNIATEWKSLSGENDWEHLLVPLNNDLREYIIHYGDRSLAFGDAYNNEEASLWRGFSRYPMKDFFSNVGLEIGNPYKYEVTKFFYARAEIKIPGVFSVGESSWIGYVAVATDEGKTKIGRRDILVAWRGTMTKMEEINDFKFLLVPGSDIFGPANNPKVVDGWHSLYTAKDEYGLSTYNKTSAREQVLNEVRRLVDLYKDEKISITVTGHSLGAALATLNAMDIVANGYNKPTGKPDKECMVTAFTIASPRVGDQGFQQVFASLKDKGLRLLRIHNANDIVPEYPLPPCTHVGVKLAIDSSTKSPYMKTSDDLVTNMGMAHQLEPYLHGVAGYNGPNADFKLEVKRDLSLLNKGSMDLLKDADKLHVPLHWGVVKNKGMVQQDDGSWKLVDYVPPAP